MRGDLYVQLGGLRCPDRDEDEELGSKESANVRNHRTHNHNHGPGAGSKATHREAERRGKEQLHLEQGHESLILAVHPGCRHGHGSWAGADVGRRVNCDAQWVVGMCIATHASFLDSR
jgi:hypothetical protein